MIYRIHYELPGGSEDWFEVESETVEGIRDLAMQGLTQRGGVNPWSEQVQ